MNGSHHEPNVSYKYVCNTITRRTDQIDHLDQINHLDPSLPFRGAVEDFHGSGPIQETCPTADQAHLLGSHPTTRARSYRSYRSGIYLSALKDVDHLIISGNRLLIRGVKCYAENATAACSTAPPPPFPCGGGLGTPGVKAKAPPRVS